MGASKKHKQNKAGKTNGKKKPNNYQKNKRGPIANENTSDSRFLMLAAILLSLLTFITYQGALDNHFVDWDDYDYVIQNNLVRAQKDISGPTQMKNTPAFNPNGLSEYSTHLKDVFKRPVALNYHPLTMLTMRWNNNACQDCEHGISARPFIAWNLILHILNSLLVLVFMYQMTKKNKGLSLVLASLFALHPMHVESVVWVSERKDVLYGFFFLSGLLTYIKYLNTKSYSWLLSTFLLFVAACMSKAMAVVFPLVMLLLYFWNEPSKTSKESLKNTLQYSSFKHSIPFFIVAIFVGIMALQIQAGQNFGGLLDIPSDAKVAINQLDTYSFLQRIQFASYGWLQYIVLFFYPHDLGTFYAYPSQAAYEANWWMRFCCPTICTVLLGITLYKGYRSKAWLMGLGFYSINLILVLQFISVGSVIMADRYSYLAYIGLGLLLGSFMVHFLSESQRKIALITLAVWCLYLGIQSRQQIETWQDSDTLWTNVIETHTKNNLGKLPLNMEKALSIRGNYYSKKAEYHATVKPDQQLQRQYIDKAFEDFISAKKLGSRRPEVYEGLGTNYGMRRQFDKALEAYSTALKIDPKKGSSYFNRGVTYSNLGQHKAAINDYSKALEYAPSQASMALVNRGISLAAIGQLAAAVADFRAVLNIEPTNQVARRYLQQLSRAQPR